MNRTEFLAALSLRLSDLPAEESSEAVKYYSEYLDEVGPDGEDAAIAELGGAEKVANIIRANCGYGPMKNPPKAAQPAPHLTLDGPFGTGAQQSGVRSDAGAAAAFRADSATDAAAAARVQNAVQSAGAQEAAPAAEAAADAAQDFGAQNPGAQYNPQAAQAQRADGPEFEGVPAYGGSAAQGAQGTAGTYTVPDVQSAAADGSPAGTAAQTPDHTRRILLILAVVLLLPLWGSLIGAVFGILGGLIGLAVAGAGLIAAGIWNFGIGVTMLGSGLAGALATMGLSLVAAGCGALLLTGCVWAIGRGVPLACRGIRTLWNKLSGKAGARSHA